MAIDVNREKMTKKNEMYAILASYEHCPLTHWYERLHHLQVFLSLSPRESFQQLDLTLLKPD